MEIFSVFLNNADPKKAREMSAYLKDQFIFLGIQKPIRAALSREFLREKKNEKNVDWDFMFQCYERPEREFIYLALVYLEMMKGCLLEEDMRKIETLITAKSWWDSVDSFTNIVRHMVDTYPQAEAFIHRWMDSDNMWLRRVSIIFQLMSKTNTNTKLLQKAIEHNLGSKEFFINKAIGWALRQYAKTDRTWVENFIATHTLNTLSAKEAVKNF